MARRPVGDIDSQVSLAGRSRSSLGMNVVGVAVSKVRGSAQTTAKLGGAPASLPSLEVAYRRRRRARGKFTASVETASRKEAFESDSANARAEDSVRYACTEPVLSCMEALA
eukprot:6640235-Pyramimonas_sp.AAC.1